MKNYTSSRIRDLKPSPTVALSDKARKLRQEGYNVINLAGGEPDFDTPKKVVEEAFDSIRNGFTHYVASQGIPSLRQRVAKKLWEENNISIDPESGLIVTPSAKFSLYISLFTFLQEGDEVLVFDPSWVSYKPLIKMTGAKPVPVPLEYEEGFKITYEKLLKYASDKTKMMIINSPNNPTGRVLSEEEIEILKNFVLKHDILVISDEIYEKIIYDNKKHISLGSYKDIKDNVITINGFSKGYAMTGWRIGYAAGAPNLIKEMLKVQQHTVTCTSSFVQSAAVKAFECEKEVLLMTKEYEKRRNFIVKELNNISCIDCKHPEGAFYIYPQIDYKNMDSYELSNYILEKAKVAATPGDAFGSGGGKCIRMSFATSMENLEKAIERINKIFV